MPSIDCEVIIVDEVVPCGRSTMNPPLNSSSMMAEIFLTISKWDCSLLVCSIFNLSKAFGRIMLRCCMVDLLCKEVNTK